MFGKSINRNQFHNYFEELLKSIQPRESVIQALEKAVELIAKNRKKDDAEYRSALKSDIRKIDTKINKFVERI